jgi:hypothetical protein
MVRRSKRVGVANTLRRTTLHTAARSPARRSGLSRSMPACRKALRTVTGLTFELERHLTGGIELNPLAWQRGRGERAR